jgi:hypothetical protein
MHTEHIRASEMRCVQMMSQPSGMSPIAAYGTRLAGRIAKPLWRRNAHDGGALEGQGQCAPL